VAVTAAIGAGPLRWGYLLTLGGLGALATGLLIYNVRSIVFSIFLAAFITVGLDPLVRWFQRRGLSRAWSIVTVILLIVALLIAIVWVVVPLVVSQIHNLITIIPHEIEKLRQEGWFDEGNAASNGVLGTAAAWIAKQARDPAVLATFSQGAIGVGLGIINAFTSGFFIAILTIYFVASYDQTKAAAFRLVSASHRDTFASYTNRILQNVGKYLSGMVILAFINAVFSTVILALVGVPGAFLIGIGAFFVTLIPLIGTVLTTIGMTILALLHSPTAGIIVLIAMLVYMQVEAYVLTPRVMSKAVQVPGSVVLISALAGGTLFGLAGALTAIPVSAGIILIIKEIVMPAKDRT
jgi:predicted PurR-regulated permease PerM